MTRTRDENEENSERTVQQFQLMEKGHPRLYLTRADIPALLAKADSESETPFGVSGKQLWSGLQATAEGYLSETEVTITYYGGHTVTYSFPPQQPPTMDNPPGHTVTRYPYWTGYAAALKERLQLLSTAHLVTGREDFAVKALSYMKALAEWETWTDPSYNCGGESCLDTTDLVTGMAVAYDMLHDAMNSNERRLIEETLMSKGLGPLYRDSLRKYDHNIQIKRVAALMTGAVALLGSDPFAERCLERASDYIRWYLESKRESDQQEGIMYASVGGDNLVRALDHLARATGSEELIRHPYLSDFAIRWVTYFMSPGGGGPANFSDSSYYPYFSEVALVQNSSFGNGMAGWYLRETNALSAMLSGFLYLNPQAPVELPDREPASIVLEEIGWAALRSGWSREDTLLAFISNNSQMGHNHYDQNSFQLAVNRSWIAADPGYQEYNPGPRNDFSVRLGHSTIQVDGQGQTKLGGGQLTRGLLSAGYDYVKGSAAEAYGELGLRRFERRIAFVKPEYYVMLDELEADRPRTFDWILYSGMLKRQTVDGVEVAAGQTVAGRDLYLGNGQARLIVTFLSDDPLPMTVNAYPGAEGYGFYTRVSGGAPAEVCQFLTVLKAEADIRPGIVPGDRLMPPYGASGSMQRFTRRSGNDCPGYRASGAGDYISAEFEVPEDGCYGIQTLFYQTPDSGQVRIYIDGQPLGDIFEGYDADRRAAPPYDHGRMELTAGSHNVRYEITGRHELAGRFDLLIDELRVLPCDSDPSEEDENRRDSLSARKLSGDGAVGVQLSSRIKPGTHSLVVFRLSASEPGTVYSIDELVSDAEQAVVEIDGNGAVTGYAATRASKLTYRSMTLLVAKQSLNVAVRCDPVHGGLLIELELEAADNVSLFAAGSGSLPEAVGGRTSDPKQRMNRLKTEMEGLVSIDLPAGRHVFETFI